jgi:hypothetical protein
VRGEDFPRHDTFRPTRTLQKRAHEPEHDSRRLIGEDLRVSASKRTHRRRVDPWKSSDVSTDALVHVEAGLHIERLGHPASLAAPPSHIAPKTQRLAGPLLPAGEVFLRRMEGAGHRDQPERPLARRLMGNGHLVVSLVQAIEPFQFSFGKERLQGSDRCPRRVHHGTNHDSEPARVTCCHGNSSERWPKYKAESMTASTIP